MQRLFNMQVRSNWYKPKWGTLSITNVRVEISFKFRLHIYASRSSFLMFTKKRCKIFKQLIFIIVDSNLTRGETCEWYSLVRECHDVSKVTDEVSRKLCALDRSFHLSAELPLTR
jgi:hypothetical protein